MTDPDEVLQEQGERLLLEALSILRTLSPDAWYKLYVRAIMDRGVHTRDAGLIGDARLLAMRGGPKFGGGLEYTNPELVVAMRGNR